MTEDQMASTVSNYEHSLSMDEIRSRGNPNNDNGNVPYRTMDSTRVPPQYWQEPLGQYYPVNSFDSRYPGYNSPHQNAIRGQYYPEFGHRRIRSGDSAAWNIHPNVPNNFIGQSPSGYPLQHSASTSNMNTQQYNPPPLPPRFEGGGEYTPPNNRQMVHSISIDSISTRTVYEHLSRQSTSFVTLQDALAQATQQLEQLEKDVSEDERELNAHLNVENPSKKDHEILKEENECLRKEIREMVNECDKYGIPIPGDVNPSTSRRRIDPRPINCFNPEEMNGAKVDDMLIREEHTQTVRPIIMQPPPYTTIVDPCPSYPGEAKPPPPPVPPHLPTRPPPPILPLPNIEPQEDRWECPKCTFSNIYVNECEMCTFNRCQ